MLSMASGQPIWNPPDQSRVTQSSPRSSVILGVAVFPIGIGDRYDEAQLRTLAGPGASSNVVKLQRIEDLPTLVTLGNSFLHKLCSGESRDIFPTLSKHNHEKNPDSQDPDVPRPKICP